MIESALFQLLRQDDRIAAACGDRIYPDAIPLDQPLPAILVQRVSTTPAISTTGFSGLMICRFQVTAVAAEHEPAARIGELIRRLLNCYVGTVAGVVIQGIFLLDAADVARIDPETKLQTAIARRQDFRVCYETA